MSTQALEKVKSRSKASPAWVVPWWAKEMKDGAVKKEISTNENAKWPPTNRKMTIKFWAAHLTYERCRQRCLQLGQYV
jgi:hypothetical protein